MAKSGETVTLACEYDLEQVALYTIKWYRNEVEFYRFVPKESPPSKAFSMPHINVDVSRFLLETRHFARSQNDLIKIKQITFKIVLIENLI